MSGPARNLVSVLTPPGRGAIAVVAASGPQAFAAIDAAFQASNGRRLADQKQDRIVFGHWTSGNHREEVVLLRGYGDTVEVHCHGGAAAVARIVDALAAKGCEQFAWANWLEAHGKDPIAIEADIALANAGTRRAAAILLDQRSGVLARAISDLRVALERHDAAGADRTLSMLLARAPLGLHLTEPWQVAIAGRPNVGKSSLINALVGYQRAIVFDQPGTTRDVLSADTAVDGWPVRLTDAAGIRATDDPLESEGVARAREQLRRSDLVLWVMDVTTCEGVPDIAAAARREFAEEASELASGFQGLVVLNKIDLPGSDSAIATTEQVVAVSALTRFGLEGLLQRVSKRLVPAPPMPGQAVPFTPRQVARLRQAQVALLAGDIPAAVAALAPITAGSATR
jgi:tRNA modification GTPase